MTHTKREFIMKLHKDGKCIKTINTTFNIHVDAQNIKEMAEQAKRLLCISGNDKDYDSFLFVENGYADETGIIVLLGDDE